MKIDVLGTEYSVEERGADELLDSDGYCDITTKLCVVSKMDDKTDADLDEIGAYKCKVVRHELVHAFLYESGLHACCPWAIQEEMVDWIAIQAPKLFQAFMEAEAL